MTDKLIKYSSRQGGPFDSNTNNLIDFDIPADGSYDFTDSYVSLVSALNDISGIACGGADFYDLNNRTANGRKEYYDDTVDPATTNPLKNNAPDDAVYKVNVSWAVSPLQPIYNIAVVKNCNLNTALKGSLEDVRRIDIFRNNLNEYTLSAAEKKSLEYNSLRQLGDTGAAKFSIFQEIIKSGSQPSANKDAAIKVHMSQLFELGKLSNYPADKLGKTRVHLELNLDKLAVTDSIVGRYSLANLVNNQTVANTARINQPLPTTLPIITNFQTLEESPYHTNQAVLVSFGLQQTLRQTTNPINAFIEQKQTLCHNQQGHADTQQLALNTHTDGFGFAKRLLIKCQTKVDEPTILITGIANGQQNYRETVTSFTQNVNGQQSKVSAAAFSRIHSIQVYGDEGLSTTNTSVFTIGFASCMKPKLGTDETPLGNGTAAVVMVPALVESIEYENRKITLQVKYNDNTVQVKLPDQGGGNIDTALVDNGQLTVSPLDPAASNSQSGTLQIKHAEIVLRKLNAAPPAPSKLNYMAITTEQFTGQPQQFFQRMFQLEPQAVNVYIMFDQPDIFDIQSRQDNIKEFRLRLDNEDLTDRQVLAQISSASKYRSPLYYDRIAMTLLNGNYQLKSLVEDIQGVVVNHATKLNQTETSERITMIANPVPVSQSEKMLQLNIETSDKNGVGKMVLFKQVIRAVNL